MPSQTFRSKVDWFFAAIPLLVSVSLLSGVPAHLRAGGDIPWPNLLVPLFIAGLFVYLWRAIRYEVRDDALVVHQPIMNAVIPLTSITKLRRTRTLLGAPALSLDRIEVVASKGPWIVISPKDKAGFVQAIRTRVPSVVTEGVP